MKELIGKQLAGKVVFGGGQKTEEGKWVVAVGRRIHEVRTGKVEGNSWEYEGGEITAVSNVDGEVCMVGDTEGQVHKVHLETKSLERIYTAKAAITALQTWAGVLVISTHNTATVLGDSEEIPLKSFGTGTITSITFSPSGRLFAVVSDEGALGVYRLGTWELIHSSVIWTGSTGKVPRLTVGWNKGGDGLALPGDVRINFLAPESEQVTSSTFQSPDPIVSLAYTHSDLHLYLLTFRPCFLLFSTLNQSILCAYEPSSTPSLFLLLGQGIYYSGDMGPVECIQRDDFHASISRKTLENSDLFAVSMGSSLQSALPVLNSTSLHHSLLGKITRTEHRSTVSTQEIAYFAINVTFNKPDFHRNLHFPDGDEISMAHMSQSGALFGSKLRGELGEDDFVEEDKHNKKALLQFKGFGGGDWEMKLTGREDLEGLCVGRTWCVVCTNKLVLRVFMVRGGVQVYVVSFPSPIVSMYSHNDTLCLLYSADLPALHTHRLAFSTYDISPANLGIQARLRCALAPIPPKLSLSWAGFSSEGILSTVDSQGDVRMYSEAWKAWERVGRLEGWEVVGITDMEIYGFEPGGKYLGRRKLQAERGNTPVTGPELQKLMEIQVKIDDQFLLSFHEAVRSKSLSSLTSLIQSLSSDSEKSKAVRLLRSLSPDLYSSFQGLKRPVDSLPSSKQTKVVQE